MATRFYFTETTAAITVTPETDWANTSNVAYQKLETTKTGSAYVQVTQTLATTDDNVCRKVYISEPIAAQTITGTANFVVQRCATNVTSSAYWKVLIKVVSNDGSTTRGELKSTFSTCPYFNNGSGFSRDFISDPHTLSDVTSQDGDRIVFEWGWSNDAASSCNASAYFGNVSTDSDITSVGTSTTSSSTLNPWCEISHDVTFYTPSSGGSNQLMLMGVGV